MLRPGGPGTPNQQPTAMGGGGPLTPQQAMQMQQSPQGPPHGAMMNPSPGPQVGGPPGSNQGTPGPVPAPGPAPMMPPGQQQPQPTPQSQAASQSQADQMKFDHVLTVRSLVWQLKDSVTNLMKIASNNLYKNSCIDIGTKTTEKVPRFDKALEEFVSICNQIELHLKTIQDCYIQARESNHHLPFPVNQQKPDTPTPPDQPQNMPPDQFMSYAQYLHTIRNQVQYAMSLRKTLVDGANKITDDTPIPPPQMPQTMMAGPNMHGHGAPTSS